MPNDHTHTLLMSIRAISNSRYYYRNHIFSSHHTSFTILLKYSVSRDDTSHSHHVLFDLLPNSIHAIHHSTYLCTCSAYSTVLLQIYIVQHTVLPQPPLSHQSAYCYHKPHFLDTNHIATTINLPTDKLQLEQSADKTCTIDTFSDEHPTYSFTYLIAYRGQYPVVIILS